MIGARVEWIVRVVVTVCASSDARAQVEGDLAETSDIAAVRHAQLALCSADVAGARARVSRQFITRAHVYPTKAVNVISPRVNVVHSAAILIGCRSVRPLRVVYAHALLAVRPSI